MTPDFTVPHGASRWHRIIIKIAFGVKLTDFSRHLVCDRLQGRFAIAIGQLRHCKKVGIKYHLFLRTELTPIQMYYMEL